MGVREAFAARFGEDQAVAIESACDMHEGMHSGHNRGSDPFKYALCIAIGFQCMEISRYRAQHGITASFEELKSWIRDNADLASHDGDYLSLLWGGYEEWM